MVFQYINGLLTDHSGNHVIGDRNDHLRGGVSIDQWSSHRSNRIDHVIGDRNDHLTGKVFH